eukprot:TRINITY_DN848_c0_g1_i2.p1 TRINITY_DN848_c0_g1~~TRINITY_DN848_c0_g1_i2.p1  ORF type:complete len:656 (+),score=152.97 TRINITY_DN848_c0_g1_i2:44-2011(+)
MKGVLCGLTTLLSAHVGSAELLFSDGFTNDMVLQQGTKSAVYGLKDVGSDVTAVMTDTTTGSKTQLATRSVSDSEWKAVIPPTKAGGDYTITVTGSTGGSIEIERATFGNVYFCSGQSNMQLPLHFTFEGANLRDEVGNGSYSNIRFYNHPNMKGQTPYEPWWTSTHGNTSWYNNSYASTIPDGVSDEVGDYGHVNLSPFNGFSATCMHFATSLIDKTGDHTTPIGLILSAVGGTKIEAWISNSTFNSCKNQSTPTGGGLYREMVAPFVNTSITGFLWYQGENSCGGFMGNSADGTGYGCAQVGLVKSWRAIWSVEEGTTSPDAPFGIVSLAAGGYEGHGYNMARMRWAQTGNYGVLPNKAMPRTFMAHGYDIGDPWANGNCGKENCTHAPFGPNCLNYSAADFPRDLQFMEPVVRAHDCPFFMGPIHPRLKYPVGRRLAEAYFNMFLGGTNSVTGPTIAGCDVTPDYVTINYNKELMKNSTLTVNENYNYTGIVDSNTMMICTGALGGNQTTCNCLGWSTIVNTSIIYCSDGPGWKPDNLDDLEVVQLDNELDLGRNRYLDIWQPAPVVSDTSSSVKIDLSRVNTTGGIFAIKYSWSNGEDSCCSSPDFTKGYLPCFPGHCPIMDTTTDFPANPFFAKIQNNKCVCLPPQVCDQ